MKWKTVTSSVIAGVGMGYGVVKQKLLTSKPKVAVSKKSLPFTTARPGLVQLWGKVRSHARPRRHGGQSVLPGFPLPR